MNKPISLIREETKIALAKTINDSGLPPMIIEPILKEFLEETRAAMKQQYETEKAQYEEELFRQTERS